MEEGHEVKEEKEKDKAKERNKAFIKGRRQTQGQIRAMQRGRGESRQTTCQVPHLLL